MSPAANLIEELVSAPVPLGAIIKSSAGLVTLRPTETPELTISEIGIVKLPVRGTPRPFSAFWAVIVVPSCFFWVIVQL